MLWLKPKLSNSISNLALNTFIFSIVCLILVSQWKYDFVYIAFFYYLNLVVNVFFRSELHHTVNYRIG